MANANKGAIMSIWTSNNDPNSETLIDHVTNFRLSREPHNYPAPLKVLWWSVLIELEDTSIDEFAIAASEYAQDFLIPVAYDAADRSRTLSAQPLVIYARQAFIEQLNKLNNPFHVTSVRLGAITPDRFLDHNAQQSALPEVPVEDGTVVQAVIDDGIAIAHDLFRTDDTSSRIRFAKIFEAEPRKKKSGTSIGRDHDENEINRLLGRCTFNGLLDEDLFYTKSGQVDLANDVFSTVALRRSHGTHVMALAAGHNMDANCTTRPIICAALPSRLVQDTTGHDLLPTLYLAFHILAKQARRFRTKSGDLAPVVFNFSYGNVGGPHDGTGVYASLFEYYFGPNAQLSDVEPQKAWLTLPAGNSNLARLHGVDDPEITREDESLVLDVQPDDRTATQVEIWLPVSMIDNQLDFATIKVSAPFSDKKGGIRTLPGQHATFLNSDGKVIASLAYQYVGGSTQRGLVTLSINPTATLSDTSDLATAGQWSIEIARNADISQDPIHTWIRRDETIPGLRPGGRQAFFNNPDYERFAPYGQPLAVDPPDSQSPVRRSGTISGFACGPTPVVVAAYTETDALVSAYSSAGPLNPSSVAPNPYRIGPDLTAKGDDSPVRLGVISAGSRSGSWVRMNGTSVAAPQVARAAAEDIHTFKGSARDWAIKATQRHPFELKDDPSASRAGAGGVRVAPPT